jgi:lysophospholipase L1-like esterase
MDLKNIIIFVIITVCIGLTSFFFYLFRNKKREITLSLFSIIFTLFISEIVLKLFYPQIMEHDKMFKYDSQLGWKFIPNISGNIIYPDGVPHFIDINSRGFRDTQQSIKTDKKKKKVLVIGDSFVSNISVYDNEVFTEVLQNWMINTEVLNFGVNGYGQVQEYLVLKEWYNKINPDVIILMIYVGNDFYDNLGEHWLYPRPYASLNDDNNTIVLNPTPQHKAISKPIWKIYKKSHLLNFLKRRMNILITKFHQKNNSELRHSIFSPTEIYLSNSQSSEYTKLTIQVMENLLLRIAKYAQIKDVPLVFALAPTIEQVEDKSWSAIIKNYGSHSETYIRTLPNDRLIQIAEDNNLKMIDLLPILQSESRKGTILYNPLELHWNKEGNRVVARSLLDYLETNSLY